MHAVPYVIRDVQRETEEQDRGQRGLDDLVPPADVPVHIVERQAEEYEDSAVNIRPVIQTLLSLDDSQMPHQHLYGGEIICPRLREGAVRGSGVAQPIDAGKEQHRRQTTCQQREESKKPAALQECHEALGGIHDKEAYKIQHHEDAKHDRYIVICKYSRSESQAVQEGSAVLFKALKSIKNKRSKDQDIQPHQAPAVGRYVSAERVA